MGRISCQHGHTRWGYLARILRLCVVYSYLSSTAQAQQICSWLGHRAALIRDSVFIEGGLLSRGDWSSSTSTWENISLDGDSIDALALLYKLDLSLVFNVSDPEPSLSIVNNTYVTDRRPNHIYGSMFVDANGFMLFGGLAAATEHDNTSSGVISAQLYPWPYDDTERVRPIDSVQAPPVVDPLSTPDSSLWHRCCGSSASVPNDHLSFYFSGLISATGAVLEYSPAIDSRKPNITANDMVMCNTTNLANIDCRSMTLPDFVKPRTEAALVWLPVGRKGSLVLFGGVESPADIMTSAPIEQNNTFMTDILLYDIATETWYLQPTFDTSEIPPQTASFCTTIATSEDQKSFHVFVYGGYDGTYANANTYDDVWALSLPSFTWVRVYDGSKSLSHGRQGHQCVSPYPNQMMTIGGSGPYGSSLNSPYAIDIFDINDLVWTSTYDPLNWSDYKVPEIISNVIGGNANGGAELPTTGLDPAVASLFKTPYQGKIPIYYPYTKKTLIQHIKSVPEWIRIIAGVLAYLILSSAAFSCVMLLWRRRYLKAAGLSGADLGPGHGLIAWSQGLYGRKIKLPTENKTNDKIEPLTIPYFDEVDSVSTRTRVSTDGNSTRTSRWSEQNSLFNEVELRTFISTDRND